MGLEIRYFVDLPVIIHFLNILGVKWDQFLPKKWKLNPNIRLIRYWGSKMDVKFETATQEEMESAKIPIEFRDYCAGALLKYLGCRADEFPMVYKCHHQKHNYMHCQFEDYVIRMKEFER